jgi:hypothetical protein
MNILSGADLLTMENLLVFLLGFLLLALLLIHLYFTAVDLVSVKAAKFAAYLDVDPVETEQYMWLFLGGVTYRVFDFYLDDHSSIYHLAEASYWFFGIQEDISWLLAFLFLMKSKDSASIPLQWYHAGLCTVGNLLVWSIMVAGYVFSLDPLRTCHSTVVFVLQLVKILCKMVGPSMYLGICVGIVLGLVIFSTLPSVAEFLCWLGSASWGLCLKRMDRLFASMGRFSYCLVKSANRARRVSLEIFFMSGATYDYSDHKVGEQQIRLVRIRKKSVFGVIRCDIFPVSLEDAKKKYAFQAISYTWGSGTQMKVISLNNRRFEVTTNAYDVLKGRSSFYESPVIWIDNICINQRDERDKNSQVSLMRDIYENAFKVLIWLGTPRDALFATHFIACVKSELAASAESFTPDEMKERRKAINGSNLPGGGPVRTFSKLLEHPYWERIW